MKIYNTEVSSSTTLQDNPLHNRLLKGYYLALDYVKGNALELGCGIGRGIELLEPLCDKLTVTDKIQEVLQKLEKQFPNIECRHMFFPPMDFPDNSFDTIFSFHVIEHIKDDHQFVSEVYRMLKPNGIALISTPNIKQSLSRNPWHIREYSSETLKSLCQKYFKNIEIKGIAGNEKVMDYHRKNRVSVNKIMRFDIFNLQYRLPAPILRIPYEFLNKINRKKLQKENTELVKNIQHTDFYLNEDNVENLDLFCVLRK